MKYAGHLTIRRARETATDMVIVYATPYPDRGWSMVDPARLKGAPETFNAGTRELPQFKRNFILTNPALMQIELSVVDKKPAVVVLAYPLPGIDPLVAMRRLNNFAIQISQTCGLTRWAIALKNSEDDPLPTELPHDAKDLPEPLLPQPQLLVASEQALRNIESKLGR